MISGFKGIQWKSPMFCRKIGMRLKMACMVTSFLSPDTPRHREYPMGWTKCQGFHTALLYHPDTLEIFWLWAKVFLCSILSFFFFYTLGSLTQASFRSFPSFKESGNFRDFFHWNFPSAHDVLKDHEFFICFSDGGPEEWSPKSTVPMSLVEFSSWIPRVIRISCMHMCSCVYRGICLCMWRPEVILQVHSPLTQSFPGL